MSVYFEDKENRLKHLREIFKFGEESDIEIIDAKGNKFKYVYTPGKNQKCYLCSCPDECREGIGGFAFCCFKFGLPPGYFIKK